MLSQLDTLAAFAGVEREEKRRICRGLRALRLRRREMARRAYPLSPSDARRVASTLPRNSPMLAAHGLMWLGALRCADLLSLRPGDARWVGSRTLHLTFYQSKQAKLRGAPEEARYWVRRHRTPIRRWLAARTRMTERTLRQLIRHARKTTGRKVTRHSWKRGRLQELARRGASWRTLRVLGRHVSTADTRLYLQGCRTPDTERLVAATRRW
eukprot:TRINITY_DN19434_c0_g1_i1.p2 TRINITY_DN19434_c0_g1~~TRINITY_DN19434_c0_g1_i1.p2  ORF type:complete len:212 (-),score=10.18 TRINITY_DN19434_c0_g1_i1:934-1569(-)